MNKIRRAVISVSDKEGIGNFAKGLKEFDIKSVDRHRKGSGTGVDVTDISGYRFPEYWGGGSKHSIRKCRGSGAEE
jgi:phosphoribosylaminoimidazolecarboxamide formyltransferase/IMP cyclohydrolase